MSDKIKVLIMGAAGRDFHNFNVYFRENEDYDGVAFTATQIPDIDGRKYPAELAGSLYPNGIPIHDEEELEDLIYDLDIDPSKAHRVSGDPVDSVTNNGTIVGTVSV